MERKKLLKLAGIICVMLAVLAFTASFTKPVPHSAAFPQSAWGITYTPGGRCPVHDLIQVPEGYPKPPDHVIWLGVFKGSWYDIGKQYGQSKYIREIIATVFDHWFSISSARYTLESIIAVNHALEAKTQTYNPAYVEMMKGEAAGAAPALAKSKYADKMTDYEKILFLNFYTRNLWGYPGLEPRGASSALSLPDEKHTCTQWAFLPEATADGKVHVARLTTWSGLCNYGVAYAAVPPAPAHAFTTQSWVPGALFSLGIANDAGLFVGRSAGAGRDTGVGIDTTWLMAEAGIFADNIEDAKELIVHGSETYRAETGRKTTERCATCLYILADEQNVSVVEASKHHWAVRYPGDYGERGFVVAGNFFLCDYNYDENDVRTEVPMYDPSVAGGVFAGCKAEMYDQLKDKVFAGYNTEDLVIPKPGSCTRYYAGYWPSVYNYGRVDVKMLQGLEFVGSGFWYDVNGKKVEYQIDPQTGEWMPVNFLYPDSTVESQSGGWPQKYVDESPSASVFIPADKTLYWNLYKASMWEGPWDELVFEKDHRKFRGHWHR